LLHECIIATVTACRSKIANVPVGRATHLTNRARDRKPLRLQLRATHRAVRAVCANRQPDSRVLLFVPVGTSPAGCLRTCALFLDSHYLEKFRVEILGGMPKSINNLLPSVRKGSVVARRMSANNCADSDQEDDSCVRFIVPMMDWPTPIRRISAHLDHLFSDRHHFLTKSPRSPIPAMPQIAHPAVGRSFLLRRIACAKFH
jgi:hypothetical protein